MTFGDLGDPFTDDILDVLIRLPNLQEISVSSDDTYRAVSSGRICRLSECPRLERIEFRGEYAFRNMDRLLQSLDVPKSFTAKFTTARNSVDEYQCVIPFLVCVAASQRYPCRDLFLAKMSHSSSGWAR